MKRSLLLSTIFIFLMAACQKDATPGRPRQVSNSGIAASDRDWDEDVPCREGQTCRVKFVFQDDSQIELGGIRIYGSNCGSTCPVTTGVLATINNVFTEATISFSCIKCFTLVGDFMETGPFQVGVFYPDGTADKVLVYGSEGECTNMASVQVQCECLDSYE